MEPTVATAAVHTPQVTELTIEETIVYEFTWRVQITTPLRAIGSRHTPRIQLKQEAHVSKTRPIAIVLPAIRQRKRSESTENEVIRKTLEKVIKPFEFIEVNPDPIFVCNCTEEKDNKSTSTETQQGEEKKEDLQLQSNVQFSDNKVKPDLNNRPNIAEENPTRTKVTQPSNLEPKLPSKEEDNLTCSTNHNENRTKERADPCARHRDWVRKQVLQREAKRKVFIKMECVNGEGCHQEGEEIKTHKEVSITDCLEEFLTGIHLAHLLDYLKVLGCMCVRDLRLLEMPELQAIQLIARRRLLQHLDSLSLHHEAPPEGCSLEAWLTWYGLTHISGFLTAIGVHSVGDLGYLKEDDLVLLKPVTRRRILACHMKIGEKGKVMHKGLIRNDYLM